MNRGAIWHGWVDTTDHSGKVIEAPPLMHMGIPASPDGHCGECPKCGTMYPDDARFCTRLGAAPAAEVLIAGGKPHLVRARQTFDDLVRGETSSIEA